MNCTARVTALVLFAIACCLLVPRAALAFGERVVVLDFDGPRGSQTRAAVVGALRRDVELVPLTEFEQAAQDAGVSSYTGRDLVAACRPVGAVAVVSGEVLREGGFVLRMTLRNCADGEVLDLYTVGFRGRRINTRDLHTQAAAMVERIQSGAQAPAQEPEPEPEPEPGPIGEGEGEGEEGEGEEPSTPRTDSFLDASLMLGLATRSLDITCPNCTGADGGQISAVVYEGGAYSEFGLVANFYPLRLTSTQGFLRNLGLKVGFARHLIASSQPREDATAPEVETSLFELGVDASIAFGLGDAPKPPLLGLALGWGMKDFLLGTNLYVESFQYRFFRFGALFSYPVADILVPFITAGYRLVSDMGPAQAFYGPDGSASGLDLSLGVRGNFIPHIIYEAAFDLVSFSLSFSRAAGVDPAGLPGTDGSDAYYRGRFSIGYAL